MKEQKDIVNGQSNFLVDAEQILNTKHNDVSNIPTPKAFVKDKGGFDYVDEAYMRNQLNAHYPIWKWEIIKYEFVGDKAILIHGRLTIIDHGIERHFDSVAAHRIAVSKSTGDYVDISNDLKSANTDAFKVAVNRLCNIADDVYRKQVADISLTKEQLDEIDLLLRQIESDEYTMKINQLIDNKSINSSNYDATIKRLNKQINT